MRSMGWCGGGRKKRERESAGDRFHKVPFVRLLSQAKTNITSIALIKKPTEKKKKQ